MKACLLVAILIASTQSFAAGPFGVDIGSDISLYSDCAPSDTTDLYMCSSLPNVHSAFEAYAIRHNPLFGVCWIKGIGKDIDDNGYGTATQSALDSMASQLSGNYGKHTEKDDLVFPDALWDGDGEWLMAIAQNERFYDYSWNVDDGYMPVNRISSVYAAASSLGRDTGYIIVEFYGDNYEDCSNAADAAEASVL